MKMKKTPNGAELTDMMAHFLKMTPEERRYVYTKLKNKIPGIEKAYKAANNVEFFSNLRKKRESTSS